MRRKVLTLAAAGLVLGVAACRGGDVVVLAEIEGTVAETGEPGTVALAAFPVRLLPYDRDAMFEQLAAAYPEPEPQVPDSIFQLQQAVQQQHAEWQQAQSRWAILRDSLQQLSRRMDGMDQSSGEYFAMFRDFNDMMDEVDVLERRSNQAFAEFTSLQTRLNESSRQIQLERQAWANEAFAPVDTMIETRLAERRATALADTTDARGIARFRGVRGGTWWVHARYDRQFDELYWNVPIEVERGEQVQLLLSTENAEVRPRM